MCSSSSVLGKHLRVQAWIQPSAGAASFLQILPGTSLQVENGTVRKEGCTSGWLPAAIRFCLSSVILFTACIVTNELHLQELMSGIKCGDFSCFFPVLPVELTCVTNWPHICSAVGVQLRLEQSQCKSKHWLAVALFSLMLSVRFCEVLGAFCAVVS